MNKNPLTSLSELLLTLNPFEFATLAYILGLILSEGLDSNAQSSLGNFYNLLGETIQTIGAQAQYLQNSSSTSSIDVDSSIQTLQKKIHNLEDIIKKFKSI